MRKTMWIGVLIVVVAGVIWLVQAGEMEPPGAPAPTMKTLDEVEPRIPIQASDLPLTILSPGSYYLVEDLDTSGGGIAISADNVTIDLMGYTLSGGSGDGISASFRTNVTVRNGTVTGWSSDGVDLASCSNSLVVNLRVTHNGENGVQVFENSAVIDTVAESNSQFGIRAWGRGVRIHGCLARANQVGGIMSNGEGTVVTESTAVGNVGVGLYLDQEGSTVIGCTASYNGSGIVVVDGSTVTSCAANENEQEGFTAFKSAITDSIANSNGVSGFHLAGGTITECSAVGNDKYGIKVERGGLVLGNNCFDNGRVTGGAGIFVHGLSYAGSRIEGNNVLDNGNGIVAWTPGNLIIRNSATANLDDDYDIVPGNSHGPIVDVSSVDDISGTPNAAHPWANFIY